MECVLRLFAGLNRSWLRGRRSKMRKRKRNGRNFPRTCERRFARKSANGSAKERNTSKKESNWTKKLDNASWNWRKWRGENSRSSGWRAGTFIALLGRIGVREHAFYVFFIFQKRDVCTFFWNDVSKSHKKSIAEVSSSFLGNEFTFLKLLPLDMTWSR